MFCFAESQQVFDKDAWAENTRLKENQPRMSSSDVINAGTGGEGIENMPRTKERRLVMEQLELYCEQPGNSRRCSTQEGMLVKSPLRPTGKNFRTSMRQWSMLLNGLTVVMPIRNKWTSRHRNWICLRSLGSATQT